MKRGLVFFSTILAVVGFLGGSSRAAGRVETSDTCGECHKEIYRMWRASAHARSMEEEAFLDAYRDTKKYEGERVSRVCLECHAPLIGVNKDWDLQRKVTWEGVNCDACHSIVSVDTTGTEVKHVLDVGEVKRGPIPDAVSSAHEVAYSELHGTSLVCAGCHEYSNAEATPLMTTYSEWRRSNAAREGKNCQACHMYRTKGDVVDPRIARVEQAEINLHEVPGGHSLEQLNRALGIGIESDREGDTLAVLVRVRNRGAGHGMPTGMPGRRVILELEVQPYAGQTFEERRVYEKFFTDADGNPITQDRRYFTKGVQIEADTRIGPDEERTESFRFPVAAGVTATVKVKLIYEHAPTGGPEGRTRLTFFSEGRTLLPKGAANR